MVEWEMWKKNQMVFDDETEGDGLSIIMGNY